ncbi:uncharacterized protein [Dysidea avara]|uniref:uncharacterized protein n=1 Tax=Dysidea avara TaxID=196820 RepID=UPI0033183917
MVHIKAYKGSEIRRFEIDPAGTFPQLTELVNKLFGLTEKDTVAINYCDRDGDIVRLSSDAELQTALKHLGEEDTWKLQIVVEQKQQQQQPRAQPVRPLFSWWLNWDPYGSNFSLPREGLLDSLFGQSLWDDDLFGIDKLWQHQRRLLNEQKKKAEMARRNAMRQASVDAQRAADEVQAKSGEVAEAKSGEVAEKKPKVVYQHFGSWEPKVEKGDNYVITTYGPVGYRVHYGHDDNETTEEGKNTSGKQEDTNRKEEKAEEATKTED